MFDKRSLVIQGSKTGKPARATVKDHCMQGISEQTGFENLDQTGFLSIDQNKPLPGFLARQGRSCGPICAGLKQRGPLTGVKSLFPFRNI